MRLGGYIVGEVGPVTTRGKNGAHQGFARIEYYYTMYTNRPTRSVAALWAAPQDIVPGRATTNQVNTGP